MELLILLILLSVAASALSAFANAPTKEQREQRASIDQGFENLKESFKTLNQSLMRKQQEMEEYRRNLKVMCDDGIVRSGEEYEQYKKNKRR